MTDRVYSWPGNGPTDFSGDVTVEAGSISVTGGVTSQGDLTLSDGAAFTTTLQCVTPTAARTISLPDLSGTIGLIGGASGQIIYNNSGAYAGDANFTWNATNGLRLGKPFGYGSGGSTQTQATSRTTAVTINNICGQITTFSKTTTAALIDVFTVNNSTVATTDVVVVNHDSGGTAGQYIIYVASVGAGSFQVAVYTPSAQTPAAAPVINFAVIKSVTA